MVWRVDPNTGDVSVFEDNLTNVMGLVFGDDGALYVLENSTAFGLP